MTMCSRKTFLKHYGLFLGSLTGLLSFLWIFFQLYVLSKTDSNPSQSLLILARYLDISFGLLGFTSSLALIYGSFVENKTWISVWTFGSLCVVFGNWCWYFYRKYGTNEPESVSKGQLMGTALTIVYLGASIPVMLFYKILESGESGESRLSPPKNNNSVFYDFFHRHKKTAEERPQSPENSLYVPV